MLDQYHLLKEISIIGLSEGLNTHQLKLIHLLIKVYERWKPGNCIYYISFARKMAYYPDIVRKIWVKKKGTINYRSSIYFFTIWIGSSWNKKRERWLRRISNNLKKNLPGNKNV